MGKQEKDLEDMALEKDMMVATQALENGDLGHALYHIGCILSKEPTNLEWLQILDRLIMSEPNLGQMIDLEKDNYYASVALVGYIQYKNGAVNEGIDLIGRVMHAISEAPYLVWIEEWTNQLLENPRTLKGSTLTNFIMRCISRMDEYVSEKESNLFSALIQLYTPYLEIEDEEPVFQDKFMVMSMLKRRVGDLEGALEAALEAFNRKPESNQATFVGLCYKAMRDIENAEKYFVMGYELDHENISGFLEMGDMLLDEMFYERAGAFYKRAIEEEPNNDWAVPSYYFCQYAAFKNQEAKAQLLHYKEAHPDNQRADYLVGYVAYLERKPYEDYIPTNGEATMNLLTQLEEKQVKSEIKLTLSALETPSAINALRLYLYDYDEERMATVTLTEDAVIPKMAPISDTGVVFWYYDHQYQQTPAVRKPSEKIKEIVTRLAATRYSCKGWYEEASILAEDLSKEDIQDLYGIMVYPPKTNFDIDTESWLLRVQYAAVFLLAHIEKEVVSNKKLFGIGLARQAHCIVPAQSLEDICYGQLDWPVIPAMVVLAYQAQIIPKSRGAIRAIFMRMVERVQHDMPCFFEHALVHNYLRIPDLEPELVGQLKRWQQAIEEV